MVGEISVWEMSCQGSVCQGNVSRWSILREVSDRELSGRETVLQFFAHIVKCTKCSLGSVGGEKVVWALPN